MTIVPDRKLSCLGIGPKIMIPSLLSLLFAGLATWYWPEVCLFHYISRPITLLSGIFLLLIGLLFWTLAVSAMLKAYHEDRLATTGIFGIVRNPIYSAWILLIFPGIALLCHSWPLLLPALVGGILFKMLIHHENDYLEKRFGEEYRRYKTEVNALIPFLPKHPE